MLSSRHGGTLAGYNMKWGVLPSNLPFPAPPGFVDFTEGDIPPQEVVKHTNPAWLKSTNSPPRAFGAMRQWGVVEGALEIIKDTKDAGNLKVQINGASSPSANNAKPKTTQTD
jgi:hypothetical protein